MNVYTSRKSELHQYFRSGAFELEEGQHIEAVSYTHLDVYKRQILDSLVRMKAKLSRIIEKSMVCSRKM